MKEINKKEEINKKVINKKDITKTKQINKIAPGIILCMAIAIPCWFLGEHFPVIGGPVFAILLGMIITLFYREKKVTGQGITFTSKKILQYAVILLGFGLNLSEIAKVGVTSLPIILSTISVSLLVSFLLHKILHMPTNVSTLIGVGSSICGGSAIAATAPVINADDKEIAQSISVIFLFNVIAALIFPTLGTMLGLSDNGFGLFAGTAVNDTSSVTATAEAWVGMHPGANTLDVATIVKLTRTLAIIPITMALAFWRTMKSKKSAESEAESSFQLKNVFPFFVLFFLLASVITTISVAAGLDISYFKPLKELSKFFIIMAMAAIGLNTDLVNMIKTGGKAILMGLSCWVAIAAVSLFMQHVIGIW